jgi:putative PIN family toxin of toxin-antitoxin system
LIIFDASSLISAAIRHDSIPDRAVRHAFQTDGIASSVGGMAELLDVLYRPRLARFIDRNERDDLLILIDSLAVIFVPTTRVTDCRDAKDNIYLELALAAAATAIVRSDTDLLVLHPWRDVPILRPAAYLEVSGIVSPGLAT